MMEFWSRCFIIGAVLICSCSAHDFFPLGHQHRSPIKVNAPSHKSSGCSPGTTGHECQFYEDYDPVVLKRSVQVEAIFEHEEYQDVYDDKNSPEYQEFVQHIEFLMMYSYQILLEQALVILTDIRRGPPARMSEMKEVEGSKEVPKTERCSGTYQVFFFLPNDTTADQKYKENFAAIEIINKALANCTDPTSCLVHGVPKCTETKVSEVGIKRSVQAEAIFEYCEYRDVLDDKTSPLYQLYAQEIESSVLSGYQNVSDRALITVTDISRGPPFPKSKVEEVEGSKEVTETEIFRCKATYQVFLFLPNNGTAEKKYEENVEAIKKSHSDCTDWNFCIFHGVPNITEMKASEDICRSGSSHHLYKYEGLHHCVTVCNTNHPEKELCYNGGNCSVHILLGRRCECRNLASTWYLDSDCRLPIHSTALYVGLSLAFLLLLLIILALTVFVVKKQRKQTKKKQMKSKNAPQWLNEDVSRPNTAVFSIEDQNEYKRPFSPYQTNRPFSATPSPLTRAETPSHLIRTDPPWTTDYIPQSRLQRQPPSQPMMFNRPEIRGSWDM